MDLDGTGIWSAEWRSHEDKAALQEAAAELEELGYSALWMPDVGGDIIGDCRRLLDATSRLTVASGILNVWMHDPAEVARDAAAAQEASGGRYLMGLGVSHEVIVNEGHPGRYGKPLATMRGYLDALDAADPPVPADTRILAALGPKMLALAGERTLGTHPYLTTPDHTRKAREALGPGALVAPEQTVILETDPEKARTVARGFLAGYLALPNYANNLLRIGFEEAEFAGGGSDRLVDALCPWGDESAIKARVDEHRAAGADHVCIQVITGRQGLPLAEWRALAPALA